MNEETQWILFFGRFHPVVLHFPIAFILLLAIVEVIPDFKLGRRLHGATFVIAGFAAASAIFAALFGWMLATSGDYPEDLVDRHRWLGIAVMVLSIICLFLKSIQYIRGNTSVNLIYYAVLTAAMVTLIFTSHDGGSLTHGKGYLTYYLRGDDDKKADPPVDTSIEPIVETVTAFDAHIAPILETHCYKCHGPEKSKGDLRLDSADAIVAGGEYEPGIDYDNLLESALLTRLLLPEDDEDVMPPDGKKRLDPSEIAVIRWWVEQGASFELAADAYHAPITPLPVAEVPPVMQSAPIEYLPEAELTTLLSALQSEGFLAKLVSKENSDVRVEVNLAREQLTDEHIVQIAELGNHVVDLDLSRTNLSTIDLSPLSKLKQLRRLNLSSCSINQAAISTLFQLKQLEFLNLYGNPALSDTSIGFVATLPNLKKLFLWQTEVSSETDALIHEMRPDLEIQIDPAFLVPAGKD
ncbi:MAG: c-type cytochrome domain-containing protein [Opitutaceae bacterium]